MAAKPVPTMDALQMTAQDVRAVFQQEVLRRERPPEQAACQHIAEVLNDRNMRFRLLAGPLAVLRTDDLVVKDFAEAARKLVQSAGHVRDLYEYRLAEYTEAISNSPGSTPGRAWQEEQFQHMQAAIEAAQQYVCSRVLPNEVVFDWVLECKVLGRLFDEAMLKIEQGREYGLAADGPKIRFIRIGLRLVAGIDMQETAIKTRLTRALNGNNLRKRDVPEHP